MGSLEKLEQVQIRILQRIAELEISIQTQQPSSLSISPCNQRIAELEISIHSQQLSSLSISPSNQRECSRSGGETTESRLTAILKAKGVEDFLFKRVPFDYYDQTLEVRKEILGAPSIEHLCKSIVLVNTQAHASVTDCSNHNNSKYYVVVIQYMARLNAESIKNFLYSLNNTQIPKKKFNLRLAPEEESLKLTGFVHNAVTCIGMETNIPVILDEAITKLEPDFFWLGGGEVDLKLGIRTPQFISAIKPFVVSCST